MFRMHVVWTSGSSLGRSGSDPVTIAGPGDGSDPPELSLRIWGNHVWRALDLLKWPDGSIGGSIPKSDVACFSCILQACGRAIDGKLERGKKREESSVFFFLLWEPTFLYSWSSLILIRIYGKYPPPACVSFVQVYVIRSHDTILGFVVWVDLMCCVSV